MVMPELAYQNEQFYPHGLKSMSKGVLATFSGIPSPNQAYCL